MAKELRISHMSVARVWRAFGLKPHRMDSFSLSGDPFFVEKVRDVVGLYMRPPDNALVLCVDEKSQIQALDRSQPMLPIRPTVNVRQTDRYIRHGTTTLFTALDVTTGRVIGKCFRRHRAKEFIRCGLSPKALQIRATLMCETWSCFAIDRVLQCVAFLGDS